jgi:hypothetical protein
MAERSGLVANLLSLKINVLRAGMRHGQKDADPGSLGRSFMAAG